MITNEITNRLLKRFPSFKLCYEKMSHNKVSSDLYITIPFGKKYCAWFTYIDKQNVCVFLEIASKMSQQICDIFISPICFSRGPIMYNCTIWSRSGNCIKARKFICGVHFSKTF